MAKQRVAIVHEWLVQYAGSERVLRELLSLFPSADLYAVIDFLTEVDRAKLFGRHATTSFIQNLPYAKSRYATYLPLMPLAIEQLNLSGYDLVISNSHAVAKGVLTGPGQQHVCYCHTPIRYAWDMQHQYLREAGLTHGLKSGMARVILHYMRQWDSRTATGVDRFIANSSYIAARIRKTYGREASVVYPPVDIDAFPLHIDKDDFYLTASRLAPYKRMDLIAAAFAQMPDRRLIVIGDGPGMARLREAAGANVQILGYQPDSVLLDYMQRARAFVFAAEEDFGITPVEAQACGTPVIAFGRGGATETVVGLDNPTRRPPTGIFFSEQTIPSLIEAVERFERAHFNPLDCRRQAETFSVERFRHGMEMLIPALRQTRSSGEVVALATT